MSVIAPVRILVAIALALAAADAAGPARGAEAADGPHSVPSVAASVRTAIDDLASPDPARRLAAANALIAAGRDARDAVVDACRSPIPEVHARAAEILMALPWYRPDDSPNVHNLLRNYGQLDETRRREVVGSLAELTQHGFDALARLIVEEPSDDVKWAIVMVTRRVYREKVLDDFRALSAIADKYGASAPLLAATGHAWLTKDVARGKAYLLRAILADQDRPASDLGEVDVAYERLQNLALLDGRFDEVARLLRMRVRSGGVDEEGEPSKPVLDLFAAHAKYGPLAGFDDDLKAYRAHLDDPRVVFALGKAYERSGRRLLADAAYRAAFAADVVSVADRFARGDFLLRHGWPALAEAEYAAVFDLSAEHPRDESRMTPILEDANAHFRLSQVGVARDDDRAAADHMRQAIELHHKANGELRGPSTEQGIWQDVNWHYLRAARTKGDAAEVDRRLAALLAEPPANPDVANDLVPMLKAAGRTAEADELLDKVYRALLANPKTPPEHPMTKNNVAWLFARCGERKEEALKLAIEATTGMPDNAAFADTLAEAYFLNGRFDEAARVERRVVGARPNDKFLDAQLKRFEDAAAAGKQRHD